MGKMEEAVAPEFPAQLNERHVVAEALLGGTRISDTSIPADDFNDEKIGKSMVHWNWKLTQRTPTTRNHCQTHTEFEGSVLSASKYPIETPDLGTINR
ncbi:unnamed protein product [Bursaphelenchus xylophilus]|uniref:(pine wood nematode) hypothetical protein n=1 Tax=Bursaphelenchus xylophilus TaxID=6326 RepID=A0A1I7S0X1_BURXY|nr:unnamed protein product [Bursaphelenchus xylophilus]CAG9087813.1 unnamed protein product [Bursaphelenchus xylophilus]